MRKRKFGNQFNQDVYSVDDMPFHSESDGSSQYFENIMIRKITPNEKNQSLTKKRIEPKQIDDAVVKSLIRLCNSVQECFALDHQTKIVENKTKELRSSQNMRQEKVNRLKKEKVQNEIQTRKKIREMRIKGKVEKRIQKAMLNTKQDIKEMREERKKKEENEMKNLEFAEYELNRIINLENERDENRINNKRIRNKAMAEQKRRICKENVENSVTSIRKNLDIIDSAVDAALSRRLAKTKKLV